MPIETDKDLSLVNQSYQALRARIVSGKYLPGMRLKLDSLQQNLGHSSSPLREALNRLVAEGLVEVEDGRGFRAAAISIDELRELTHLRILLEGEALKLSVLRGDDEWEGRVVAASHRLRKMEERLPEVETSEAAADETADEWSARHREFHFALLGGCGYPRLLQLCRMLFDQAERYRRIARQSPVPRKKSAEHKRIEDAALGRDADKAVELLTRHIQRTAERVIQVLGDGNSIADNGGSAT
jgi:GntR family transcriptional regulator, carbon starvation induced regulator